MDAYESLNQEGLDYDSAKDLLDNHIRGLEFEQDGLDDEIVISSAWMRTFTADEPAHRHLKRYMKDQGWWEERVDTSNIEAHDLANMVMGWMFGDGNRDAVCTDVAKDIRGDRNAGKEPTIEELAGYVLRAIGSKESVASYLQYQLAAELADED